VDAMESGGSLQVRVAAAHRWSDGAEGIRITVADNGSGIPRETLGRSFEPFYTTKQEAGTGIGLWVCRGIVEKHGGAIRVRSRVDGGRRGTVFSVFLPAAREAVPATDAAFPVS
jgi:two-component system NtrC family sensor kinase